MLSHFKVLHFKQTQYLLLLFLLSGCSYRLGFRERSVPGGYKEVAIPIFKNRSMETGVETAFTNALVLQFERSQVARVTNEAAAPVRIEGEITKVMLTGAGGGLIGGGANPSPLPTNAALWTQYQIDVQAKIVVRRQSDDKILWQSTFNQQTQYDAPQIGEPIVNSADATYNDSARRHAIEALADDMMAEAHDRITENF